MLDMFWDWYIFFLSSLDLLVHLLVDDVLSQSLAGAAELGHQVSKFLDGLNLKENK